MEGEQAYQVEVEQTYQVEGDQAQEVAWMENHLDGAALGHRHPRIRKSPKAWVVGEALTEV